MHAAGRGIGPGAAYLGLRVCADRHKMVPGLERRSGQTRVAEGCGCCLGPGVPGCWEAAGAEHRLLDAKQETPSCLGPASL